MLSCVVLVLQIVVDCAGEMCSMSELHVSVPDRNPEAEE
jgi:hypothetical protein